MKRIDLPEIEDLPACPAWVRDAMTGYLRAVLDLARPYDVVAPLLAGLLREARTRRVVDLASGGGGPWPGLRQALAREGVKAAVTLTDMYPNRDAATRFEAEDGITYRRSPVSALDVPPDLADGAVRTIFTGLHHFSTPQLRSLLRACQADRAPVLAAEATHRSFRGLLISLATPFLVLLLMPSVRPRRPLALLLTYLPPVLPLLIWWDGFASTLKTHRAWEIEDVLDGLREPGYSWRVEELRTRGSPAPVTVLVGRPG